MTSAELDPDLDDDARFRAYGEALADGLARCLPSWMDAVVAARARGRSDVLTPAVRDAEVERVVAEVRALVATDVDAQSTSPLEIVRSLVPALTDVLTTSGVSPIERDPDAVRLHPTDVYDLTPANLGQIDPELTPLGIAWGAAKAHLHLSRRRAEGLR